MSTDRTLWLDTLVFVLLVSALASPYLYERRAAHERNGRDLVLVLDASGSMGESGFDKSAPERRKFDAVRQIVRHFIDHRYDDNIGLVVFGTFAFGASPVTYDLQALGEILERVDVGIAGSSTAIGEGIAQAVRALSFGRAKEKMIVLLTDGRHNAGSVSPKEAVEAARRDRVKIYTIGIGSKGSFDETMLRRIAEETGGRMFASTDAEALQRVYQTIDELEPSPLRSEGRANRIPLYLYLVIAAASLLAGRMVYATGRGAWRF
ncbi:VWA domain-containing protein [Hydrogenimonas sp.]